MVHKHQPEHTQVVFKPALGKIAFSVLRAVTGTIQKTTASSGLSVFMLFEKQPHSKLDHILPIRVISQLIFNSSYFYTQNLTLLQAEKDREKPGVPAASISEEPGYATEAYDCPYANYFRLISK